MNDFAAKIWELIVGLVKHAYKALPGLTGKERKEKVIEWVKHMVNMGEALIAPLAAWANTAIVDGFEGFIIGLGVEWAWTQLQLPKDDQVPVARNTPELLPLAA